MNRKRERVIETGRAMFLERGIQGTSMEQIAEAVPVSKMTLYNYFHNKEGLLEHIIDRILSEWEAQFQQLVREASDPLDCFVNLSRHFDMSQYSEAFMKDLLEHYPTLAQKMLLFSKQRIVPELEKLIFRGQQAGQIRKDISPHVLMMFLMGLKEVFARPEMFNEMGDLHAAGEQMMSIIYYGVVAADWRNRG